MCSTKGDLDVSVDLGGWWCIGGGSSIITLGPSGGGHGDGWEVQAEGAMRETAIPFLRNLKPL